MTTSDSLVVTTFATVLEPFTGNLPQLATSKIQTQIITNVKNKSQTSVTNGCPVGLGFTMTLGGDTPLVLLCDDYM